MVVKTSICKSVDYNKRCEVSENNLHLMVFALYRTFYCDKRKYHRHFANILALFYTNGPRVENKKGIFLPFCCCSAAFQRMDSPLKELFHKLLTRHL